jgi:hypothetical protein
VPCSLADPSDPSDLTDLADLADPSALVPPGTLALAVAW